MPAKPRRLLPDVRRAVELRRVDERLLLRRLEVVVRPREAERVEADFRALDRPRDDRDELDDFEREALERPDLARVELDFRDPELPEDFLPRWDLVSPFSRRILFTVRAATSSARPP